jgi:hypothetical protein
MAGFVLEGMNFRITGVNEIYWLVCSIATTQILKMRVGTVPTVP